MDEIHVRSFAERELALIEEARRAAGHAISYREFRVGAAVLAYSSTWGQWGGGIICPDGPSGIDGEPMAARVVGVPRGLPDQYRIYVGSNLLLEKGGPKICAEQQAIGVARTAGAEVIVGLVVAGEPQRDDVSGCEPPTLHPCYNCRYFLERLPEVKDDTIVLTVCNHTGPTERHSVRELLELHKFHQERANGQK